MNAQDGSEQAALTFKAMQKLGLSPDEVWLHCISSGSGIDEFEFNAYLHGILHLPVHERDIIAHAVNELLDDIYRSTRAPYSDELARTRRPRQDP